MDEAKRQAAVSKSITSMEALAAQLRRLIASQPPQEFLGYLYSQRLLGAIDYEAGGHRPGLDKAAIDQSQLVLEYIHAVWAATSPVASGRLDEKVARKILKVADELRTATFNYCMFSSAGTQGGVFGDVTQKIEFVAKSTWVMLRGNRYQVLEEEFFAYVLAPHDEALRRVYGVSAREIAVGFQRMADAIRVGHMRAADTIEQQMKAASAFTDAQGGSDQSWDEGWKQSDPDGVAAAAGAMQDLLFGGICNMSRHAGLPAPLLDDLSFEPGEEAEFFAAGEYCGTPLRTLPARKKPLIRLAEGHFATDPCFIRDSGYRALLWNLLRREPGYDSQFREGQQTMSEGAFVDILAAQLAGAQVYRNVYYRDVQSHQWVENDLLVVLDDALVLVEAKAGAAASVASPASDFARHVRSVQDLVVKAHAQCKRFFDYLASADEVPIHARIKGRYVEVARLRRDRFRLAVPIGLTIESFAPFSAMSKELPDVKPLLGAHPFVSLSIDDLFVLARFLPTTGEFLHYLQVRQLVAGLRQATLFDEVDHLGAYVRRNRFDLDLHADIEKGANMVVCDGESDIVDRHFEGDGWATRPVPTQPYPSELRELLAALDRTRSSGWLAADRVIRDQDTEGRQDLADCLAKCRPTLVQHPRRYFHLGTEPSLFVWLQRAGSEVDSAEVQLQAAAARIAMEATDQIVLVAQVHATRGYLRAECLPIETNDDPAFQTKVLAQAEKLRGRITAVPKLREQLTKQPPRDLPGRNDPCWCGSNVKFKKCHGAAH